MPFAQMQPRLKSCHWDASLGSSSSVFRLGTNGKLANASSSIDRQGLYGAPVSKPPGAIVLRPHWQYSIKRDGTWRLRNCCDRSPRAAPILHGLISTYSSCVEQPIQRMFFSLAASLGYNVYGGDALDAFAHSPPPVVPTYVSIDDAYADWYFCKTGRKIDRSKVLPVLHALQGHPESGKLWESHINLILFSPELNFKCITHDRTIYSTTFRGVKVLLLCQVDDFALASPDESIAKAIYDVIGNRLTLPGEDKPPFAYIGLVDDYNGVQVEQSSTLVSISAAKYICLTNQIPTGTVAVVDTVLQLNTIRSMQLIY